MTTLGIVTTTTATITSTMTTSGMNYKINLHVHIVVPQHTTIIVTSPVPSNEICDTSLVAGVSVPITAIITSIITAIVSSIITYWCCVKRTSSVPAEYETPITTTVDVQPNVAYGHVSGDKIPSTAVYETVSTDL